MNSMFPAMRTLVLAAGAFLLVAAPRATASLVGSESVLPPAPESPARTVLADSLTRAGLDPLEAREHAARVSEGDARRIVEEADRVQAGGHHHFFEIALLTFFGVFLLLFGYSVYQEERAWREARYAPPPPPSPPPPGGVMVEEYYVAPPPPPPPPIFYYECPPPPPPPFVEFGFHGRFHGHHH